MGLFDSGVRPIVDEYLLKKSQEERDYGPYWSASSAGYCHRKLIFDRLKVPHVKEQDARKTRVFEVGHVFHGWFQDITKEAGVSIAQEVELQDEGLMVRGHFDDLVLIDGNLILYDIKTQNSRAFTYQKGKPMSHYHKMQVGTYMYMLRDAMADIRVNHGSYLANCTEARILKISKDDLRMTEEQLLWTPALEKEVYEYWSTLNGYWKAKKIPKCTCADYEGGFLAREPYNDFFYNRQPCSLEWYELKKAEGVLDAPL